MQPCSPSRSCWLRVGQVRVQRLVCHHVQRRANAELRRHALIGFINSHQNAGSSQHRHFGMTHLITLSARQDEPKRNEGLLSEQFSECLYGHTAIVRVVSSNAKNRFVLFPSPGVPAKCSIDLRRWHHLQFDVAPESAVLCNDGNATALFCKQGEDLGSSIHHAMQNRLQC